MKITDIIKTPINEGGLDRVKAVGKKAGKYAPMGVGVGFGLADAAARAAEKDYVGAGIAGVSTAAAMVPGPGTAVSGALDAVNVARDEVKAAGGWKEVGKKLQPSVASAETMPMEAGLISRGFSAAKEYIPKIFKKGEKKSDVVKRDVDVLKEPPKDYSKYEKPTATRKAELGKKPPEGSGIRQKEWDKMTPDQRQAAVTPKPAEPAGAPISGRTEPAPRTGSRQGQELDLPKPGETPAAKAPAARAPETPAAVKPTEPPATSKASKEPTSLKDKLNQVRYGTKDPLEIEAIKQARINTKRAKAGLEKDTRELPPNLITKAVTEPIKFAAKNPIKTLAGGTMAYHLAGEEDPFSAQGVGSAARKTVGTAQDVWKAFKGSDSTQQQPGADSTQQQPGAAGAGQTVTPGRNQGQPTTSDSQTSGSQTPTNSGSQHSWIDREGSIGRERSDLSQPSQAGPQNLSDYDPTEIFKDDPQYKRLRQSLKEPTNEEAKFDPAIQTFMNNLVSAESGGKNIANRMGSSAHGLGQFLQSTFQGMVKRAKPDSPLYGKSWEDYKRDTNLQMKTLEIATQNYVNNFNKNKIPVTPGTLYMAHHFGPETAVKMINAGPDTKLVNFFPEYVKTRDKKTGQLKTIVNPVYAQNPALKPNQSVKYTYDRLSNVLDKKSKFAKVKQKATDLGTAALATVTGASQAQAGELPANKKPVPPKAEPKPEPKAEPKPEPKAEPKPEPKAELKPEPKPELKAEPKAVDKKDTSVDKKNVPLKTRETPWGGIYTDDDLKKMSAKDDIYKPAPKNWDDALDKNALSVTDKKQSAGTVDRKVEPVVPDTKPEKSSYDKFMQTLTGKEVLSPEERNKIRVPESVNNELNDILWLAGRKER